MASTTPVFGLPYPDGNDTVSRTAVSDLALAVENTLADLEGTSNPDMITLTMKNGWSSLQGDLDEPLRVYRMGRLIVVQGEVIHRGGTNNTDMPSSKYTFATLPLGYRPAVRNRQAVVKSSAAPYGILYIETNGDMAVFDSRYFTGSQGYSVATSFISAG